MAFGHFVKSAKRATSAYLLLFFASSVLSFKKYLSERMSSQTIRLRMGRQSNTVSVPLREDVFSDFRGYLFSGDAIVSVPLREDVFSDSGIFKLFYNHRFQTQKVQPPSSSAHKCVQ